MTQDDKITWRLLLVAAVLNIAFVIVFYFIGRAIILLIFLGLGILLLLPPVLVVWAFFRTLRRKAWRTAIPELIGCVLVGLIPVAYYQIVEPIVNRQIFFFDLPDGTEMTVWKEYLVFEHYDSFRAPKDNYIYMGKWQEDYAVSISNEREMSVWVRNNADKIEVSNPRFPLVGIYEGENNGGKFWFNKETPITSTWVKLAYNYMRDGLFSGGYYDYYMVRADSIEHRYGAFPGRDYYLYRESDNSPKVLAIDSVARKDSIDMAREMKLLVHYQDSVQHSQLSVTYPQKGGDLWRRE